MIFAAGKGTRLKPITDTMPKALVPVSGKPLLQHVIDKLEASGIGSMVVNVHHFADQIKDYLRGTGISISDESDILLETGGGLKKARPLFAFDTPVLIHNVDIFSNVDLRDFYDNNAGHDATLLVSPRKTSRYLLVDKQSKRLMGWTNIDTGEVRTPHADLDISTCERYAFAGIHLFSPALFPLMDQWPERFSIIDFYLKHCAERDIYCHIKQDLKLLDVGKMDTLEQAETFAKAF